MSDHFSISIDDAFEMVRVFEMMINAYFYGDTRKITAVEDL